MSKYFWESLKQKRCEIFFINYEYIFNRFVITEKERFLNLVISFPFVSPFLRLLKELYV